MPFFGVGGQAETEISSIRITAALRDLGLGLKLTVTSSSSLHLLYGKRLSVLKSAIG